MSRIRPLGAWDINLRELAQKLSKRYKISIVEAHEYIKTLTRDEFRRIRREGFDKWCDEVEKEGEK